MKKVIEHYGTGLLGMISALAICGILMLLFGENGVLSGIVADYMSYLSG